MRLDNYQAAIIFSDQAKKKAKAYAKSYTDTAIAALPKGVVYKGAVSYYADLPQSGQEVGDCYTVKYEGTTGTVPNGSEYVWGLYEGTLQWILLGKQVSFTYSQTTLVIDS